MRISNGLLSVIMILVAAGCRSGGDYKVIKGEAVRLIDFPVDPTISFVGTVKEFVDIHDPTKATYRGLFMPEIEYVSFRGTRLITNADSVIEEGRTYRFYGRPRPSAAVPEKAKRTFHRIARLTGKIRLAPPPDSARYFDIYKIQQLSDTPLYRIPQPIYQIDIDTP